MLVTNVFRLCISFRFSLTLDIIILNMRMHRYYLSFVIFVMHMHTCYLHGCSRNALVEILLGKPVLSNKPPLLWATVSNIKLLIKKQSLIRSNQNVSSYWNPTLPSSMLRCSNISIVQMCISKVLFSSLFFWFPAGAVVSSKGERGKPSRGTSKRREQRELETLWSLSSFKWKQLHRPPVLYLFPASLSPLFPLTLFPLSLCTSHLVLSLVLSAPRLLAS